VRTAPPPLVPELLTGAVLAASAWIAQTEDGTSMARALRTAGLCWLAGFGLAAVWVDAVHQRLPDRLVLPAGAGSVLLFCSAAFCNSLPAVAVRTVLAAATTAAVFLLLALFADVGLGDVKLAAPLGAALGYASWSALWLGAVLTFLLAGLFVALRMLIGHMRRGDQLALGPFLLAGCFATLCLR
jgi:leader peptidase (prepilin peptidase) / N-methyltransferase